MQLLRVSVLLLLVCAAKGQAYPNEASDTKMEDEETVVAELARRLRPLESLESKQRRLEELEARQNMLDNLENSHRSLDGADAQFGCGGGCSKGKVRSKVVEDMEAKYLPQEFRPRPIYGLLNNILETARYGHMVDRPRAHIIF